MRAAFGLGFVALIVHLATAVALVGWAELRAIGSVPLAYAACFTAFQTLLFIVAAAQARRGGDGPWTRLLLDGGAVACATVLFEFLGSPYFLLTINSSRLYLPYLAVMTSVCGIIFLWRWRQAAVAVASGLAATGAQTLRAELWRLKSLPFAYVIVIVFALGATRVLNHAKDDYRLWTESLSARLRSDWNDTHWRLAPIFPEFEFREPMDIVVDPLHAGVYQVLERRGVVLRIDARVTPPTREVVLDISDRVGGTTGEKGAASFRYHPRFDAGHPFVFVHYTSDTPAGYFDRLSRFEWRDGALDRESERILIEQVDRHPWHNGGGLAFDNEGLLYVGIGDEGDTSDSFENAQRIDHNLFSGVLRIDVDQRGGDFSHPIRKQPVDGKTAHYYIPNDNPFCGRENVLEEFYSIGLRNPYRIWFDAPTQRMWAADVGQATIEEVNWLTSGSNHGWSYLEGSVKFRNSRFGGKPPADLVGTESLPVFQYPHAPGRNCIIGGVVARGTDFPELEGRYLYGDAASGELFALSVTDDDTSTELLTKLRFTGRPGICSVTQVENALIVLELGTEGGADGGLYRLERGSDDSAPAVVVTPEMLYGAHCSRCHDADGRGTGLTVLTAGAYRDFTDAKWQAATTDDQILAAMRDGVLDRGMPAWRGILSDEEIASLVAVVRGFELPASD